MSEPLDFKGTWTVANNLNAEVKRQTKGGFWVGWITVCEIRVPTLWDKNGCNANPLLNLIQRKLEGEGL